MSLSVTISNRQRQVKIDLKKWRAAASRLFEGVLSELDENRPRHLSRKRVEEIAAGGKLSIIFVSDKKIRELNKVWRGKDKVTDVLSFPAQEEGCALAGALGDPLESLAPELSQSEEAGEVGELVISLNRAGEQALEYGHSFDRELSFLIVHGILHVLGFDHITKAQEKEMFARQARVLEALSISRDRG